MMNVNTPEFFNNAVSGRGQKHLYACYGYVLRKI